MLASNNRKQESYTLMFKHTKLLYIVIKNDLRFSSNMELQSSHSWDMGDTLDTRTTLTLLTHWITLLRSLFVAQTKGRGYIKSMRLVTWPPCEG